MSTKLKITLGEIQNRSTGKSFARGENYYNDSAIFNTIRRENIIEAQCQGSYPQPYRTVAEFEGSQLVITSCDCEYDWGGDCKHIVALLLTYLHDPEKFEERVPIADILSSRSKEDLIDIIKQMIVRYPDLQSIVDRPTKNEIAKGTASVDFESIRKQLSNSLSTYYGYYDDYGHNHNSDNPYRIIHENLTLAKRFAESGDYKTAHAIYIMILEEFGASDPDYYHDEDGELAIMIDDTIDQIPECLDQQDIINNDSERQATLNALLDVHIWNIDFGGIDIGVSATDIVLQYCKQEDIPDIRQKIEQAKARKSNTSYSSWGVEAYDGFLMELDVLDNVDPEITLQRLRDEGMYHLLISKLLELDRVNEAETIIQDKFTNSYGLLKAFYILATHEQLPLAISLAEKQLGKGFDTQITDWLIGQYEKQEDHEKILHWRLIFMRHSPNEYLYKNIKSVAQTLNKWDNIRPQIIDDLKTQKAFHVLIRAYLHDEEWELAWKTLPKVEERYASMFGYPLEFQIAEASRYDMPERALPIYIKHARRKIDQRSRSYYQEASNLLSVVQQMYDQLDEYEKWEELIDNIRTEFKRLPALQDELNKAGL